MKSKYWLTLIFIGILPVFALAGFYLWTLFNQGPSQIPQTPSVNSPAVQTTINSLQAEVQTIASSLFNGIKKTHDDIGSLAVHSSDADLSTFKTSHPGVMGIVVMSPSGVVQKSLPANPALVDSNFGSSDEFKNILERFKSKPGETYQFYTQRLGYPAFIFALPLPSNSVLVVVFNLGTFFRDMDTKSGEIFLLDAGSGRYFYHSNPSKLSETFNSNQESWLNKVLSELSDGKSGASLNPPLAAAVYAPMGFGKFGIVHTVPFTVLQPPEPAAKPSAQPSLENLPQFFQSPAGMGLVIAMAVLLGWIFIVGALCFGLILKPLRKASGLILNASQGSGVLSAESVKSFGNDEVGQIVQSASLLMVKSEKEKSQINQEKEEALHRARVQVDEKTKEAASQVATAQQQAQSTRNELNEKNQQLSDKLKELDALKNMSEGLRNQVEQTKNDNSKFKGQIASAEQEKTELQKKITDSQAKLNEMEAKLLQAVSVSSAIQVSQVRAAAIRTMSEEFKTTLGIIKGYVSSALGSPQGGISEKQQEFLGMVINRSARLEKFINDLLDVYQVEVEMEDAKREEVNLAAEIESLAFNFQAQAEVKNLKLRVEAKPNLPNVPIVRRRFNQLWNILYLQVIKDAPRGSVIPITVESIGDNMKVTFPDPGLIVAPDKLPKLFDEFYDPKHPASAQLAGTGLKFALVKTILGAHGGGAVAEKGDPGTRLILTFPTKIKKTGETPVSAPFTSPPTAKPSSAAPAVTPKSPMGPGMGVTRPGAIFPSLAASRPPASTGAVPGSPAIIPKPAGGGTMESFLAGKTPLVTAQPQKPAGVPPKEESSGLSDIFAGIGKVSPPTVSIPKPTPASSPMSPPSVQPPATPKPSPPPVAPVSAPLGIAKPPAGPGLTPPKPPSSISNVLDSLLGNKGISPQAGRSSTPPPAAPKPVPPPPPPNVVPTDLKTTTPPKGILDMDTVDSVKLDTAPSPPKLPMPPGGLNANKPIVKDLNKEGDGDLIE